jgi:hypothetical protein
MRQELLALIKLSHKTVNFTEYQRAAVGSILQTGMNDPIAKRSQEGVFIIVSVHELTQFDQQINHLPLIAYSSVKYELDLA